MDLSVKYPLSSLVSKGLLLSGLAFVASSSARAEKVTVTAKGTVAVGGDLYGIFGVGKDLRGQDFTLVVTFDDAGQKIMPNDNCPNSYSTAAGSRATGSPATAVLTIGNGSFTFGSRTDSTWSVGRALASFCSKNVLSIIIDEGVYPQKQGITLRMTPANGQLPISDSLNWHSAIRETKFDNDPRYGTFMIVQPRDFMKLTNGSIVIKSLKVE